MKQLLPAHLQDTEFKKKVEIIDAVVAELLMSSLSTFSGKKGKMRTICTKESSPLQHDQHILSLQKVLDILKCLFNISMSKNHFRNGQQHLLASLVALTC